MQCLRKLHSQIPLLCCAASSYFQFKRPNFRRLCPGILRRPAARSLAPWAVRQVSRSIQLRPSFLLRSSPIPRLSLPPRLGILRRSGFLRSSVRVHGSRTRLSVDDQNSFSLVQHQGNYCACFSFAALVSVLSNRIRTQDRYHQQHLRGCLLHHHDYDNRWFWRPLG